MLIKIHPENPSERKISQVVDCLKDGGVIICPTDTIYTFACDLNNKKAIERMAQIKGVKPEESHFSIICYDLSDISHYTAQFDKSTFKLMKKTLPGPYTYILTANKNVPKLFDFKKKTIGIRIPDNSITRHLVYGLGNPIIATSVHNQDDEILDYLTDPVEIHERYANQVDMVIDGGAGDNRGSTVIDATNGDKHIVRNGKGFVPGLN